jgi:hypothetical protein
MLAIMALDRWFRPKVETRTEPAPPEIEAATPIPTVITTPGKAMRDNEAAAIALAIAMARQAQARPQASRRPERAFRLAPPPWMAPEMEHGRDAEAPPQVVTVLTIDPGPGAWRGRGRVQALQ